MTNWREYDLAVLCYQNESYEDDIKLILAYADEIRADAAEKAVKHVEDRCYCGMTEEDAYALRLAITGKETP